jgi:hypothetical protein
VSDTAATYTGAEINLKERPQPAIWDASRAQLWAHVLGHFVTDDQKAKQRISSIGSPGSVAGDVLREPS